MKHKISAKRLSDTLFEIAKNNDSIALMPKNNPAIKINVAAGQ